MDEEDEAEMQRRVIDRRRKKANDFSKRVDTWIRPPQKMDSELADEMAAIMGKDLYALYAGQIGIEAVQREPEPDNMHHTAIILRENNGKMLIRVIVSAQFGSKWEGEVTVATQVNAGEFLGACEEASGLKLGGYLVSYNGRLLTKENGLFEVGVRDGKKIVLLPTGKALNYRPNWSVRQTDQVAVKMEERHKKVLLSGSTQELIKDNLGKDLYKTFDGTYKIVDKAEIDPEEDPKTRAARELKEKRMAEADAIEHTNMYSKTWGEKPEAEYKRRNLKPLAGFCQDKAKMARARRPLQNYEESMKESTTLALMGKHDKAVPRLDSLKQWFATYGESENFFKSGNDPLKDTVGTKTEFGFINRKPQGVMSKFEQSSKRVGKEKSRTSAMKKGNVAA